MTPELKRAFDEAKKIIYDRNETLVDAFPVVHELDDGILIKFFSGWENSVYEDIKLKKISSLDKPDEKIFLGFIPKGIKMKGRSNIFTECLICLDGSIIIDVEGDVMNLDSFTKICIEPNKKYSGEAVKDSYFILIGSDEHDK